MKNISTLLAKKLLRDRKTNSSPTSFILNISFYTVLISTMVLLIALITGRGFQEEIRNRLTSFSLPMRIGNLHMKSLEASGYMLDYSSIGPILEAKQEAIEITKVGNIAGLMKNGVEVQSIVYKGYDSSFSGKHIEKRIIEGRLPAFNLPGSEKEVLISKHNATKMKVSLDGKITLHFLDKNKGAHIVKQYTIVGIFDSGIQEFDKVFIIGSLSSVQKARRWKQGEFSYIEVDLEENAKPENVATQLNEQLPLEYQAFALKSLFPDILLWTESLDNNIYILLIIIGLVAGVNMISTLLTIVLEKSAFIGITRTLGIRLSTLRIFFIKYLGLFLLRGLLIGNIIALVLCLAQQKLHFVSLNPESYHMDSVPIDIQFVDVLFVNAVLVFTIGVSLFLPTTAIRFLSISSILQLKQSDGV